MEEIPDQPVAEDQERDDWAQSLANRIAVARTAAGLTQQDLADKVGVSRPQITNLECGRGDPSLSTLRGIAAGVGVAVGTLLGEGDDPGVLHFVTTLLGQQRTMASHLVALADATYGVATAYEATELDVKKIKESAYRAGREAAARDSCGCLGYVPVPQETDQPRKLQQQCPERHFGCRSCRCVLPAGHDGEHDVHCGQPA